MGPEQSACHGCHDRVAMSGTGFMVGCSPFFLGFSYTQMVVCFRRTRHDCQLFPAKQIGSCCTDMETPQAHDCFSSSLQLIKTSIERLFEIETFRVRVEHIDASIRAMASIVGQMRSSRLIDLRPPCYRLDFSPCLRS